MKKTLTDIEINQEAKLCPIKEVAIKSGVSAEEIITFGKYKAKLNINKTKTPDGKLVLVTAINPTPAGEGKTTISIGLSDALCALGKKSVLALREPSLGPVFGRKGGATGGGQSQVAPIVDINLHFTGDLHAISSANNLIASAIDNSIYWSNPPGIKTVWWKRCIDLNDRSLRNIETKIKKNLTQKTSFQITAASEIMAIVALAENMDDLIKRLEAVIVGLNEQNQPVYLKELKIVGSVAALLKDAMLPNVVQTLENNLALIHAGPFANIAHGCNSIIATKEAMKIGDIVITEAGFGADLGAEKFLNIKSRIANIAPNLIIMVVTIRALKFLGGKKVEDLKNEDLEALSRGFALVEKHLKMLQNMNIPTILTLNLIKTDTKKERKLLKSWAKGKNFDYAVAQMWEKGSKGGVKLANLVVDKLATDPKINHTYDVSDSIPTKIEKIAKNIYGATKITYTETALKNIAFLEKHNLDKQYLCMARTPASLSNDPQSMGLLKEWTLEIKDVSISNGAGFIIAYCGNIMTMPGLPRSPQAEKINVKNNKITGLD